MSVRLGSAFPRDVQAARYSVPFDATAAENTEPVDEIRIPLGSSTSPDPVTRAPKTSFRDGFRWSSQTTRKSDPSEATVGAPWVEGACEIGIPFGSRTL